MKEKKILIVAQEITPFVAPSPLADVGRNLPQALQEKGYEIRTFMPKWGNVNERRNQLHEVIRLSGMNLIIDETDHPLIIKVASIQAARMQVYFIDNDDYFQNRGMMCDREGKEYEDNDERTIFFGRGVLKTVQKLRWVPDVIHCHGWMTALIPLYIKTFYKDEPSFRNAKVVYSLYDNKFTGSFHKEFLSNLLLKDMSAYDLKGIKEPVNYEELCKLAITYSDGVVQNSEAADEPLLNFARSKKKPILDFQSPDTYADAVDAFYDGIIS